MPRESKMGPLLQPQSMSLIQLNCADVWPTVECFAYFWSFTRGCMLKLVFITLRILDGLIYFRIAIRFLTYNPNEECFAKRTQKGFNFKIATQITDENMWNVFQIHTPAKTLFGYWHNVYVEIWKGASSFFLLH